MIVNKTHGLNKVSNPRKINHSVNFTAEDGEKKEKQEPKVKLGAIAQSAAKFAKNLPGATWKTVEGGLNAYVNAVDTSERVINTTIGQIVNAPNRVRDAMGRGHRGFRVTFVTPENGKTIGSWAPVLSDKERLTRERLIDVGVKDKYSNLTPDELNNMFLSLDPQIKQISQLPPEQQQQYRGHLEQYNQVVTALSVRNAIDDAYKQQNRDLAVAMRSENYGAHVVTDYIAATRSAYQDAEYAANPNDLTAIQSELLKRALNSRCIGNGNGKYMTVQGYLMKEMRPIYKAAGLERIKVNGQYTEGVRADINAVMDSKTTRLKKQHFSDVELQQEIQNGVYQTELQTSLQQRQQAISRNYLNLRPQANLDEVRYSTPELAQLQKNQALLDLLHNRRETYIRENFIPAEPNEKEFQQKFKHADILTDLTDLPVIAPNLFAKTGCRVTPMDSVEAVVEAAKPRFFLPGS